MKYTTETERVQTGIQSQKQSSTSTATEGIRVKGIYSDLIKSQITQKCVFTPDCPNSGYVQPMEETA